MARRQGGAGGENVFSDDLDLGQPSRGRNLVPIVIAIVVVVALAIAAVVGWRVFLGDNRAAPRPSPTGEPGPTPTEPSPTRTEEPSPTPPPDPPTQLEQIEAGLGEQGFECFDTLADPVPVRSCYAIAANAAMAVRIQHAEGEVSALRAYASLSSVQRDGSLAAFGEVTEAVSAPLLADGDELPPLADGRENARLSWGGVNQVVGGTTAVVELVRKNAEPRNSERQALRPGVRPMRAFLRANGFRCNAEACTRNAGRARTTVELSPTSVVVGITQDGKPVQLPEGQTVGLYREVLAQVIGVRQRDAALAWFDEHRGPQLQRADFAGVHVQVVWGDGTAPRLNLSSAAAWN